MALSFVISVTILALAISPCLASAEVNTSAIIESLTVDFYKEKCPQVEKIVAEVFKRNVQKTPGAIPGIMRLHFHDCFITGCDGSILLRPERYNYHNSEMAHPANGISLRGMDVIDDIKAEVEKQCPNVVSCTDILAYAARDAIVYVGNPHYTIPAGRRDGVTVDGNLAGGLPKGSFSIELLTQQYAAKGLTVEDLVVLEGAHSIGQSRCLGTISDKDSLANVTGAAETLDKQFGSMVNQKYCPPAQVRNFFNMTLPLNPKKNDSDWGISFYQNIIQGHSALPCDLAMAAIPSTKGLVHQYAANSALWKEKFNQAMIKLGKLNVLTGEQGEIRKHCGLLNAADIPAQ